MPAPCTREFCEDVVRVARAHPGGVTLAQVAKDFGVHEVTLPKWLRNSLAASVVGSQRNYATPSNESPALSHRRHTKWKRIGAQSMRRKTLFIKTGNPARLIPGFRSIAREMGKLEDCHSAYTLLSWQSHPGYISAYRSVSIERDCDRIRIDYSTELEDA